MTQAEHQQLAGEASRLLKAEQYEHALAMSVKCNVLKQRQNATVYKMK